MEGGGGCKLLFGLLKCDGIPHLITYHPIPTKKNKTETLKKIKKKINKKK